METSRFEMLKQFVEAKPDDCFVRYGLAQEYVNRGQLQEAAAEFNKIIEIDPGYQAAYYHGGQTLKKMGRITEARSRFQKGIQVAGQSGDLHAKSELEAALEELSAD